MTVMPELHCMVLDFATYWLYNVWNVLLGCSFEKEAGGGWWWWGEEGEKIDWSLATHSKIDKSVPNFILKLWGEQNSLVFCVSTVVVMLPVALKLCKKTSDLFFEVHGVCVAVCRTCISWQLTILVSFGHGNCFTFQVKFSTLLFW